MKPFTKFLMVVLIAGCLCWYFQIDVKKVVSDIYNSSRNSQNAANNSGQKQNASSASMPENTETAKEVKANAYDEVIQFLMKQKKDMKLIQSYRVIDDSIGGNLKNKSYIIDDALAVIAFICDGGSDAKSAAYEILKNMSAIQSKDGSWYDIYDTSGNTVKDVKKCSIESNSLLLYAYSYYTIVSGDKGFKDCMKSSANFLTSRYDSKNEGLVELDGEQKSIRKVIGNIYGYFALREYALSLIKDDYDEYKEKTGYADRIAAWIINSGIEKGVFIKEYSGKDKSSVVDLDTQIMGSIFIKSSRQYEKVKYEEKDFNDVLSKLVKKFNDYEEYKIDNNEKNGGFIWCEGSCKVPLAYTRLGNSDKARKELEKSGKLQEIVSENLSPRGITCSTNADRNIEFTNLESVRASAWYLISYQCLSNTGKDNIVFGKEADIFNRIK